MYRTFRIARIIISLLAMAVPTWALIAGYESVFVRMQVLTALASGTAMSLLFWLAITLVYGRIYCSTVCPLGTLTDCFAWLWRKVRRSAPDYRYRPPSGTARALFMLLALALLLAGGSFLPTVLDPYAAYSRMIVELIGRPFGRHFPAVAYSLSSLAIATVTAIAVAGFAWRRGRLLCNTACPVGTIWGVASRRAVFHMEIDPDRCINCGECARVCKSECIKLPDKTIDLSRCVVCFDCAAACPNSAINYKTGRYRLDMPMLEPAGPQNIENQNPK